MEILKQIAQLLLLLICMFLCRCVYEYEARWEIFGQLNLKKMKRINRMQHYSNIWAEVWDNGVTIVQFCWEDGQRSKIKRWMIPSYSERLTVNVSYHKGGTLSFSSSRAGSRYFLFEPIINNKNISLNIDNQKKSTSFGEIIAICYQKYFVTTGRARRSEFWLWCLYKFLVYIGFIGIILITSIILKSDILTRIILATYLIFIFSCIPPTFCVAVRRLHDMGYSGWALLIVLIPSVGFILSIIWLCADSQPWCNNYGDNPKLSQVDTP